MKSVLLACGIFVACLSHAQNKPAAQLRPEPSSAIIDKKIASMLNQISADSIRSYIARMADFQTRHSLSDTTSAHTGIGAARRWVAVKFNQFARRQNARLEVIADQFTINPNPRYPRVPYRVTMKNVMAILPGTDLRDDRVIIVSGHLDSRNSDIMDSTGIAPGANDDASGVAVVLELARVMSARQYPCTLIFLAVQGEEQGLLGARHMAGKMKRDSINVVAMLNNDVVGNSVAGETGAVNEKTVRVFSEMIPAHETDAQAEARKALKAANDSPSRQLARYIRESAQAYLHDFSVTVNARPDRFLRGGDHTPFNQLGFTAVRFTEFHEDYAHQHQNVRKENNLQYGDLPDFVDYDYAANVARINLIALASLAQAPAAPEKVEMKMTLGNITYLNWNTQATGRKPKGYYVLMRETYQPFWETKFFVADSAAALPYSKDNYFFAVQSVGEDGHVSLPVMPVPVRE